MDMACLVLFLHISDGSRISRKGGAHTPDGVRQLLILQIFCQKLHENESIWTGREHVLVASLGSATAKSWLCLDMKLNFFFLIVSSF